MRFLHFLFFSSFFHFVLAFLDNLYDIVFFCFFFISQVTFFFLKYIIVCYWNYMHIILVCCIYYLWLFATL